MAPLLSIHPRFRSPSKPRPARISFTDFMREAVRWFMLLALLPLPAAGQYTLYTCMVTSKGYVVGAKLPPSGLFLKSAGEWRHAGYNHPLLTALDYDPHDPSTLYVAAGNGLLRVTEHGE